MTTHDSHPDTLWPELVGSLPLDFLDAKKYLEHDPRILAVGGEGMPDGVIKVVFSPGVQVLNYPNSCVVPYTIYTDPVSLRELRDSMIWCFCHRCRLDIVRAFLHEADEPYMLQWEKARKAKFAIP